MILLWFGDVAGSVVSIMMTRNNGSAIHTLKVEMNFCRVNEKYHVVMTYSHSYLLLKGTVYASIAMKAV